MESNYNGEMNEQMASKENRGAYKVYLSPQTWTETDSKGSQDFAQNRSKFQLQDQGHPVYLPWCWPTSVPASEEVNAQQ